MGGVAPGRSARGSISREAWTEVREMTGCVERQGRREQDEFTSDTPLLQVHQLHQVQSVTISTMPHPQFHSAPVDGAISDTPCSTMPC